MNYHDPKRKNGTIVTRLMCAVLFCMFSFAWLFWFQADVITVAQHVLSKGVTHYNRTVGAVLITLVLMILQLLVATGTKLMRRTHALTYLPSMLLLAVLSDVNADANGHFSFGAWSWGVPLVLLLWGGAVWAARQVLPYESDKENTGLFSRRLWINVLLMACMMLFVAVLSNTNAVFLYRTHAEVALSQGDTEEALRVGSQSLETDENLTMLRIYALSRRHELGERLFLYALKGNSNDMLPANGSRSSLLLLPADSIWRHLGARPAANITTNRYLELMERDTLATEALADYLICARLIDRDIDGFVRELTKFYSVNDSLSDSLPHHYREALILYSHLRSNPSVVYHHAAMEEDWADMQELERRYTAADERKVKVAERYAGSYWFYYFY